MPRDWLMSVTAGAVTVLIVTSIAGTGLGQVQRDPIASGDKQEDTGTGALPELQKIALPTLGGAQFWGDEFILADWRIQRSALTGSYRLLDPRDRLREWGTLEKCRQSLTKIAREQKLRPLRGRVVVLLHGLGRTRGGMDSLRANLAKHPRWSVVSVSYPSTRDSIQQHAESLHRILRGMPLVEQFDFVGHSMGNIVVRRYLKLLAERKDKEAAKMLKRVGRIVMMCPPNHGAIAADKLSAAKIIGGTPFQELGSDWATLEPTLATPHTAFGILAGGKGDQHGYNPLIPGDDDMVVSVATTRLASANDFRVIDAAHTFFMDNDTVQLYVQRFLQHGYFESAATRRPLRDEPDP